VKRVTRETPEGQWFQSKGDKLLRETLVECGFKDGTPDSVGGWRCYLTNAIKSVDRAEERKRLPREDRERQAKVWAPLLAWEIQTGKPRLVVAMGKAAAEYLTAPVVRKALTDAGSKLAEVDHYTYIAMRADPVRRLGPGHPIRIAEYKAKFARIAERARK
jgi:uracil-DNA glycosylase